MSELHTKIYKCPVCDTVVEVLEHCGLELVCCGPEMIPLREKTCGMDDPHALIVERCREGIKVRVGSSPHGMDEEHHIVWIEVNSAGKCYRQFLSPGDEPEAVFRIDSLDVVAKVYCNAHGLWRSAETGRGRQLKYQKARTPAMMCA